MEQMNYASPLFVRSRRAYSTQCMLEYFIALLVSDAFLSKLLTVLGLSDAQVGVISSLISAAFLFQLASVFLVDRIRRVKRCLLFFTTFSQMLFASLYFLPFLNLPAALRQPTVVCLLLLGYFCNYFVTTMVFQWGNSFVSPDLRGEFSAGKEMQSLLGGMIFTLLIGFILVRGVPNLSWDLFSLEYNSENVSLLPALFNTVLMTLISLLIAVPLGVGGAIYLAEYANRESRLVKAVRVTAETLSGIPSILYGLFGMMFFVTTLKWSYSLMAGGMTLAIMILPLILRTTEEALNSIPDSYREGSFGLGAGRMRTVLRIVLPPAGSGILAGIILAIGRVVGETAALIYTAGTVANFPKGLMSSGRTLAVHMYVLSGEGLHVSEASATAVVLLVIVVGMNALSSYVAKKLTKG